MRQASSRAGRYWDRIERGLATRCAPVLLDRDSTDLRRTASSAWQRCPHRHQGRCDSRTDRHTSRYIRRFAVGHIVFEMSSINHRSHRSTPEIEIVVKEFWLLALMHGAERVEQRQEVIVGRMRELREAPEFLKFD